MYSECHPYGVSTFVVSGYVCSCWDPLRICFVRIMGHGPLAPLNIQKEGWVCVNNTAQCDPGSLATRGTGVGTGCGIGYSDGYSDEHSDGHSGESGWALCAPKEVQPSPVPQRGVRP